MGSACKIAAPARNTHQLGPVFEKVFPMADPPEEPRREHHVYEAGRRKESQCEQENDESRSLENKTFEYDEISDCRDTRNSLHNPFVQPHIVDGQIFMKLGKIIEQEIGRQEGREKEKSKCLGRSGAAEGGCSEQAYRCRRTPQEDPDVRYNPQSGGI